MRILHRPSLSRLALVAAAAAACCAAKAAPEREITWILTDRPPLFILRDGAAPTSAKDLGDGLSDRRLKALIAAMPGYVHRFKVLNVGRTWLEMGSGAHVCISSSLRNPERDKVAYFTPFDMVEGLHLVIRADKRQLVSGGQPSVSLASLVRRKDVRGALTAQRSYTMAVDEILAKAQPPIPRVSTVSGTQFLGMLAFDRMDYTIEYPAVVEDQLKRVAQPAPQQRIEVLRIDEVPSTVQTYAACTRDAWGERTIRDIDAAVHNVIAADRDIDSVSATLSPEVRREFLKKIEAYRAERVKRPAWSPDM